MNIIPHVENVGTGAGLVFKQETTSNTNELKRIKAGTGISVSNGASDITIAQSGNFAEETVWLDRYNQFGGLDFSSAAIGLPDVTVNYFAISTDENVPYWFKPKVEYTGGNITAQLLGMGKDVNSSSTHTIDIYGRWLAHGDTIKVAFVASPLTFSFNMDTDRQMVVTDYGTMVIDGTYSDNDILFGKIERTDSQSDNPSVLGVRFRYPVSN